MKPTEKTATSVLWIWRGYAQLRIVLKRMLDFGIWILLLFSHLHPVREITPVKRVLLVNLQGIGDLVMTTAALAALKKKYPKARVDYAVHGRNGEIFKDDPRVDRVLSDERGFWELLHTVRNEKYDIAINLYRAQHSAFLTLKTKARVKLGYFYSLGVAHNQVRLLNTGFERTRDPRKNAMQLMTAIGCAPTDSSAIHVHIPKKANAKAKKLLRGHGKKVVLNPNNEWFTRSWPKEHFVILGRDLVKNHNARVFVIGSNSVEDQETARYVAQGIGKNAVNLAGKLSIGELAAVLKEASVFVTTDSGPMHLAAAVGTKTVALFGPTDPAILAPYKNVRVIKEACDQHYNFENEPLYNNRKCMEAIEIEEVLRSI